MINPSGILCYNVLLIVSVDDTVAKGGCGYICEVLFFELQKKVKIKNTYDYAPLNVVLRWTPHAIVCENVKCDVGRGMCVFGHCCINLLNTNHKRRGWEKRVRKKWVQSLAFSIMLRAIHRMEHWYDICGSDLWPRVSSIVKCWGWEWEQTVTARIFYSPRAQCVYY